jgi:hypothetical protein
MWKNAKSMTPQMRGYDTTVSAVSPMLFSICVACPARVYFLFCSKKKVPKKVPPFTRMLRMGKGLALRCHAKFFSGWVGAGFSAC